MLDDARETLGAALKRRGHSAQQRRTGPLLEQAKADLVEQKPLVRAYNSSNFDDVLLSGDVWLAQGWSGQFAKVMSEDPDIAYVVPKEGATLFIDSLAIPATRAAPGAGARLHRLHARGRDRGRDLPDDALLDAEPRGAARSCPREIRDEPRDLPAARRDWPGSS